LETPVPGTSLFRGRPAAALSLLLASGSIHGAPLPVAPPAAEGFTVEKLAEGVYAVVRREPPSLYFESNSLFIIGDSSVAVVDAQFSLASTRAVLAALRGLTAKPVKYVINTHGHDDHVTGNQVYRDAFPGVEFIAHRSTRDEMVADGARRRTEFLAGLPGTIGYFRSLLVDGKGPDGEPISEEERAGFAGDSAIGARFLAEAPSLELVPATSVVDDRLTLRQGTRTIEILHLARGHSAGDLIVYLPAEKIVAAGDLVVAPVPLVGSTSHPAEFIVALDRLRRLKPAIIVPGHGPIQRDLTHVDRVIQLLVSIREQVSLAIARGDSLPAVRKSVNLDRFQSQFAGQSRLQRFVFQNYVTFPAVAGAYADATPATPARVDLTANRVAPPSRTPLAPGILAIAHVNLIAMESDRILENATLVVRNGRIAEVGPSGSVRIPVGARTIDGRGKYLIPGLADMHAHLFSDSDVPDSVGPYELGAMVANGITVTRLMMGTPAQLQLRRKVMAGQVAGPQMWLASPEFAGHAYGDFHGEAVPNADAARAAVKRSEAEGYDFLKITLFVGREAYDALTEEAGRRGIPVVGHVDPAVGVPRALAAGQHIEHLDNYVEQILADTAPMRTSVSDRGVYQADNWLSLNYVDPEKLARIAGLTARSGTYTTPTLTIFKNAFALGIPDEKVRAWPDYRMYPAAVKALYGKAQDQYWARPVPEELRLRWVETRNRLVRAIADSGGRIMAGSDAPEFFHSYGWTLHRELQSLVAAGLTPYEALVAATRTPAQFLGAAVEWGTIVKGKRADLVLLSANPLADISNTTRIEGVAVGGRWFGEAERQRMIREAMVRLSGEAQ
jgi:imidazolonepropionase-like amidohydrolase/glyoxylase-like metal-dependent hydrolase (beta-lactamase superfamily II)